MSSMRRWIGLMLVFGGLGATVTWAVSWVMIIAVDLSTVTPTVIERTVNVPMRRKLMEPIANSPGVTVISMKVTYRDLQEWKTTGRTRVLLLPDHARSAKSPEDVKRIDNALPTWANRVVAEWRQRQQTPTLDVIRAGQQVRATSDAMQSMGREQFESAQQLRLESAGWPAAALWGAAMEWPSGATFEAIVSPTSPPPGEFPSFRYAIPCATPQAFGLSVGPKGRWAIRGPAIPPPILPWHPIWPGLLANTAFYGVIGWALWFTPGAVRRGLRRRRGACVRCGYDLRGAEVIPEAGAACPECGDARHAVRTTDPTQSP
jgi:hypothetical protein